VPGTRRHIKGALGRVGCVEGDAEKLDLLGRNDAAAVDRADMIERVYVYVVESRRDMEEIMEVLKLCIVQGAQACNLGVPILAEETAAVSEAVARP
jgi:hypothetical protein